ncbi:hypothetical protein [uncultured Desulfobacter sp.]|uniref:hypothetical protein n=1 Tax=uncultured Desulfobacter sp. TaxID=240139 RepID=UPI0029C88E55|nr:hypothetical protein [uncultured Desulfobacter sp.]
MNDLTPNGIEYYKTKQYWTPAEAAGFVMGVEIETFWYTEEDYEAVAEVIDASVKAVKDKKISICKEIVERDDIDDLYSCYFPTLYRQDEVYKKRYLPCFNPLEYMAWIISEKIIRISESKGVTSQDNYP